MRSSKLGFLRRLFGLDKSEPTKKGPPQQEKNESPKQETVRPARRAAKSPPSATKLKAHPPGGPTQAPGVRPPDERKPGTRKKGTADDKPKTSSKAAERKRPAPPPHGPYPKDDTNEKSAGTMPATAPPNADDEGNP
jgi:hypothetical protein